MLEFVADGETPGISARFFLDAMQALLGAVREVDRAVNDVERPSTDWKLSSLRTGSAVLGVAPAPERASAGALVESSFYDELQQLVTTSQSPTAFATATVAKLLKLTEQRTDYGVSRLLVHRDNGAVVLDDAAAEVLRERLRGVVESLGSVTGVLENIHTSSPRWYVGVREDVYGVVVRCYTGRRQLPGVPVRARLTVRGTVRRNVRGVPVEIVDVTEVLPLATEEQSPSLATAYGTGPPGDDDAGVRRVRELRGA